MSTSPKHAKPPGVQKQAGRPMRYSAHRATRRNLCGIEGRFSGSRFSRKNFDLDGRFSDPALHQRPCWLLDVNEFAEWTHLFEMGVWDASDA